MSDARSSAAVTERIPPKVFLAAGLVALCLALLATVGGAVAPAEAQAAAKVCGAGRSTPRSIPRSLPRVATASRIGPLVAAEWLGARAGTALAEKGFLTALQAIMKAAGHRDPAERTLEKLDEVKTHLNEISVQLGRIEGRLDGIASIVHNQGFENVLRPLCAIARAQDTLFVDFYEPMFDSGKRLVAIVEGKDPAAADRPGKGGVTPLQEFEDLRIAFMERARVRETAEDFQTLHDALMPGALTSSVLRSYGKVLLGQRTLTREDSIRLLTLYRELAAVRAVATFMSEELWVGEGPSFVHLLKARRETLINDAATEERALPPMIPAGVVIDVGSGATGTGGKPMWYAGADKTIKWLPPTVVGPKNESIVRNDGVDEALKAINSSHWDPKSTPGPGWKVPTRQQFEALISTGCVADPADPKRFEHSVRCTNAVPASGGTVAGYLARLNPGNSRWEQLFCTGITCPKGAGPDRATHRNTFIWTREIHTENTICGEEQHFFTTSTWRRQMHTYTGFSTTADKPDWHAYPQLRPPSKRGYNAASALKICDDWFKTQINEAPARNIELSGILLATRYADAWDRNPYPKINIDYMAQP